MNRLILIAGVAALLGAAGTSASVAQTQAPARPPAVQAAPAPAAPDMGMPGRDGRGGMHRERGGRMGRGGLTVQEAQARNAAMFAQLDANRDGRGTFEEFRAFQERRRLERQRQAFQGLSGGQDSITLDQLNARTAERFSRRDARRGGGGEGGGR